MRSNSPCGVFQLLTEPFSSLTLTSIKIAEMQTSAAGQGARVIFASEEDFCEA